MSNRSLRPNGWNPDIQSHFATPAALLGLWNPFLVGMAQFNGHAAEGFGTVFSELQHFVTRRLGRDMQLVQQLANCKSPDQVAAAYADFWQKAFADYSKEFTTMSRLLTANSPVEA